MNFSNIEDAKIQAKKDIDRLSEIFEMNTRNIGKGSMRGHFSHNEYFFFRQGKEMFRSKDRIRTINWLASIYCTIK